MKKLLDALKPTSLLTSLLGVLVVAAAARSLTKPATPSGPTWRPCTCELRPTVRVSDRGLTRIVMVIIAAIIAAIYGGGAAAWLSQPWLVATWVAFGVLALVAGLIAESQGHKRELAEALADEEARTSSCVHHRADTRFDPNDYRHSRGLARALACICAVLSAAMALTFLAGHVTSPWLEASTAAIGLTVLAAGLFYERRAHRKESANAAG